MVMYLADLKASRCLSGAVVAIALGCGGPTPGVALGAADAADAKEALETSDASASPEADAQAVDVGGDAEDATGVAQRTPDGYSPAAALIASTTALVS